MPMSQQKIKLPLYMKCIVYGLEVPQMTTRPTPKSRKGHILVRVEAVGLNPVDAKEVIGDKLPHKWTYTRSWLRSHVISTKIPGFDFAGTCLEDSPLGGGKQFSIGEKVFGTMPPMQGTLAEFISVPTDQVATMPSNLKCEEAAALPLVGYGLLLFAVNAFLSLIRPLISIFFIGLLLFSHCPLTYPPIHPFL
jgi:reticulon-4-interacting protein 1, mitochondrial